MPLSGIIIAQQDDARARGVLKPRNDLYPHQMQLPNRCMIEPHPMRSIMLTRVFEYYQRALALEPICGTQQRIEAGRKVALALRGDYSHS